MTPDSRWLEILKASGWQTAAIAAACALFLFAANRGLLPPLDPWMVQLAALAFLVCGFLALASFISATLKFFPIQTWVVHWVNIHRGKKAVRDYIPHMTPQERAIIAYLLAKNQKMFTTEGDGGYAKTLISRRIVVRALAPNQMFDMLSMPVAIPGSRLEGLSEAQRQISLHASATRSDRNASLARAVDGAVENKNPRRVRDRKFWKSA